MLFSVLPASWLLGLARQVLKLTALPTLKVSNIHGPQ
jgi:hypothetical protein